MATAAKENALLSVLTDKGLVSAPIDYFDERLRARITDEWQPCGRVNSGVMETTRSGALREFHSDVFIFARLLRLLDNDEFEGETDEELWSYQSSRVRRRPRSR